MTDRQLLKPWSVVMLGSYQQEIQVLLLDVGWLRPVTIVKQDPAS
jgi:hypothetical protein